MITHLHPLYLPDDSCVLYILNKDVTIILILVFNKLSSSNHCCPLLLSGKGHFMHFSTASAAPGDRAFLESRWLYPKPGAQCLQFFLYNTGATDDVLNIWVREYDTANLKLFKSISGSESNTTYCMYRLAISCGLKEIQDGWPNQCRFDHSGFNWTLQTKAPLGAIWSSGFGKFKHHVHWTSIQQDFLNLRRLYSQSM